MALLHFLIIYCNILLFEVPYLIEAIFVLNDTQNIRLLTRQTSNRYDDTGGGGIAGTTVERLA